MKKLLLVGALALFGAVNAQQNSVKVNPFAILGGSDMVSYERAIDENSTIGVGTGFSSYKVMDAKYSSIAASVFYRYYFKEALKGWYANAGVNYYNGKTTLEGYADNKYNSFGVSGKMGYQFLWDSGFTLDLNAGLTYRNYKYDNADVDSNTFKASGVGPAFGIALGYSW